MTADIDLYAALVAAGCEVDHHESDLYVRIAPAAAAIIQAYETRGTVTNRSTFRSAIDGSAWYDLPFHYTPYWEAKRALHAARSGG